ncbi:uncharacterized protein LOC125664831 [Ostrea edulis]|uniref:uncharacterized protein LOC125664831 n=1 Tax=Ostrea edulis TaxID=37623 RepID=UPI002095440F|nr:uncharacterized protein LOC125664831 [Ostrea edulis]
MAWLYFLLLHVFQTIHAQTATRFQNPWINVVRRHACSIVECNIGETCDLSYENCRPSGPCLLKQPTCVSAFNSARPGLCPSPAHSILPRFTLDCFDDPGCSAARSEICCHSYYGSYCWDTRRQRTGRSLIPRIAETLPGPTRRRARNG